MTDIEGMTRFFALLMGILGTVATISWFIQRPKKITLKVIPVETKKNAA